VAVVTGEDVREGGLLAWRAALGLGGRNSLGLAEADRVKAKAAFLGGTLGHGRAGHPRRLVARLRDRSIALADGVRSVCAEGGGCGVVYRWHWHPFE